MKTNDRVERILETVTIPTLPDVVLRINNLLNDPDSGMPEVAEAVAQDASISAKVLRMANSAFYSLAVPVSSVHQAALVLGAKVLKNIAMQASVVKQYEHLQSTPELDLSRIWKHAVLTAQISRRIASWCQAQVELGPDEYYTAGLLHDIGKIVLLDSFGGEYAKALSGGRTLGHSQAQAEKAHFGICHAEVGALVASQWKLPQHLVDAIRLHHEVTDAREAPEDVVLVMVANTIANSAAEATEVEPEDVVGAAACERIGLEPTGLRDALAEARESWASIEV